VDSDPAGRGARRAIGVNRDPAEYMVDGHAGHTGVLRPGGGPEGETGRLPVGRRKPGEVVQEVGDAVIGGGQAPQVDGSLDPVGSDGEHLPAPEVAVPDPGVELPAGQRPGLDTDEPGDQEQPEKGSDEQPDPPPRPALPLVVVGNGLVDGSGVKQIGVDVANGVRSPSATQRWGGRGYRVSDEARAESHVRRNPAGDRGRVGGTSPGSAN
jgi:hypothetical protein